jgi:hypothetical protein
MNALLASGNSFDMSAAGPLGRGCVVVVTAGTDVLPPLGVDVTLFLLLEHAASPTSATATAAAVTRTRTREISWCRSTVVMHSPRAWRRDLYQKL